MTKVIIVDNSTRDADRVREVLARDGITAELCHAGATAQQLLTDARASYAAALILWELAGSPVGSELLAQCRNRWPQMPVIVMSGSLDASLATRAFALGARLFRKAHRKGTAAQLFATVAGGGQSRNG